jgi:thiol-disulfide isomerase/thioredoxin
MNAMKLAGTLLLVVVLSVPALALKLGDPAPPIGVEKWVKGGPVDLAATKGKNVVVVEFWATWCGPCRASIPHLSALQKKYKDEGLVVVGVSSSDKTEEDVTKFVKAMGDKMDYVVAYESMESRQVSDAYMKPFEAEGTPHAFVVDKNGRLVWHGHPMVGLEEVVKAVLKGDQTPESLYKISQDVKRAQKDKAERIRWNSKRYYDLVAKPDQVEASREKGEKLFAALEDDYQGMNELAWTILTGEEIQSRDLELALRIAAKATELSGGEEPAILDTYARALFDNGKIDAAVQQQKKAVEFQKKAGEQAKGRDQERHEAMLKELEASLKKYEDARKS